jgi:uncharacterized membrane protein YjjP (DUF1212 family)
MADDTIKVPDAAQGPDPATLCVLLGRTLFNFGATTQRIQDSIEHLARHLGCKVDMLLSYDALLITVNDGETLRTRIDSSHRFAGLNLVGLIKISQWLRTLPDSQLDPAQLDRELTAIRDQALTHGLTALTFAAACAGAAFCIVNSGDPASWICSAGGSALIFVVRRKLLAHKFNIFVAIFASALAGSVVSGLLGLILKTGTPAITLIAPLLFMVPGVPLITGGIDIVRNHVTLGVARIGFALAVLVALCLGVGLTLPILRLHKGPLFVLPPAEQIFLLSAAGALGSGALACLNNGAPSVIALCALGGSVARLIRAVATASGLDVITASLIGVICSTLIVGFIAGRLRWPAIVATVMAALPMIPGYFAIDGLHSTLLFATAGAPDPAQLITGFQSLWRALFISVALVVGVIGPMAVLQRDKEII